MYAADAPGGFGPALQIVTDHGEMLMDSVTVLLHRLGVAYVSIMNPRFTVRRGPAGELLDIAPAADGVDDADGTTETWIHVQLSPSVDRRALAEAQRLLPNVLADSRQVELDSAAMHAALVVWPTRSTPTPGDGSPGPIVATSPTCCAGSATATSCCSAISVARCATAARPSTSRAGWVCCACATKICLSSPTTTICWCWPRRPSRAICATAPTRTSWWCANTPGRTAVEHRFVGLFTVAAMNANVLEIPLISRRVRDALAMAGKDPSQPGQLLLDVLQTVPRSELFTLSAQELHDMATAVIDLGSRRRTLLFARADQLGHFVSCLVYLPRDRYTTAVRLEMQDILVREFGGVSIEYAARVSESPWALVHFTVKLPDGTRPQDIDASLDNETRIQTPAHRGGADLG